MKIYWSSNTVQAQIWLHKMLQVTGLMRQFKSPERFQLPGNTPKRPYCCQSSQSYTVCILCKQNAVLRQCIVYSARIKYEQWRMRFMIHVQCNCSHNKLLYMRSKKFATSYPAYAFVNDLVYQRFLNVLSQHCKPLVLHNLCCWMPV